MVDRAVIYIRFEADLVPDPTDSLNTRPLSVTEWAEACIYVLEKDSEDWARAKAQVVSMTVQTEEDRTPTMIDNRSNSCCGGSCHEET